MLYEAQALTGFKLNGTDGEIGKVKEFYFDDHHWAIRYMVADTGGWLPGRRVLISPYALAGVSKEKKHISISLSKKQIEGSPSLDSDKPVSRQFENTYYAYYGWPMYWAGGYMWGSYSYPTISGTINGGIGQEPENGQGDAPYTGGTSPTDMRNTEALGNPGQNKNTWDPNLRSTHAVTGYHIQAKDGEIGHVEDFLIDDETWAIRYMVVNTSNWWMGNNILVSPRWIERVDWDESKVFVALSRETIKLSPEYTEASLLTREYETGLHQHYNRQGYWVDEPAVKDRTPLSS